MTSNILLSYGIERTYTGLSKFLAISSADKSAKEKEVISSIICKNFTNNFKRNYAFKTTAILPAFRIFFLFIIVPNIRVFF